MLITAKNKTLRELRQRAGLSQEELADLAGISRGAVYEIEANGRKPHPKTRRQLTESLNRALGRSRDRDNYIELSDIFPIEEGL